MVITTRAQRAALKRVFDRTPLFHPPVYDPDAPVPIPERRVSYRDFRKTVQPTFGCDGAVTVPWCGMWLCIERDGYTHS